MYMKASYSHISCSPVTLLTNDPAHYIPAILFPEAINIGRAISWWVYSTEWYSQLPVTCICGDTGS